MEYVNPRATPTSANGGSTEEQGSRRFVTVRNHFLTSHEIRCPVHEHHALLPQVHAALLRNSAAHPEDVQRLRALGAGGLHVKHGSHMLGESDTLADLRIPNEVEHVALNAEQAPHDLQQHMHVLRFQTPTKSAMRKFRAWVNAQHRTFGHVDVWQHATPGNFGDVCVAKHVRGRDSGLQYETFVPCLKEAHKLSWPSIPSLFGNHKAFHMAHHSHNEMQNFVAQKVAEIRQAPGVHVEHLNIGKSSQGRAVTGIRVSAEPTGAYGLAPGDRNRPEILLTGGMHAREWIAPAVLMKFMDNIRDDLVPGTTGHTRNLLEHADMTIFPMVNPDGFEYSRMVDRSWRKTRTAHKEMAPFRGVDPNRNFDSHWSEICSHNPRDEDYHGPRAESEPVVQNLSRYMRSRPSIAGFIDWHSYGQYILFPFGFTKERDQHYADQMRVHTRQNEAIQKAFTGSGRSSYTVGPVAETLYTCSGGVIDFAKEHANIKYAACVELPGHGGGLQGFYAPASEILPVAKHSWAGLQSYAGDVVTEFMTKFHDQMAATRPRSNPLSDARLQAPFDVAYASVPAQGYANVPPQGYANVPSQAYANVPAQNASLPAPQYQYAVDAKLSVQAPYVPYPAQSCAAQMAQQTPGYGYSTFGAQQAMVAPGLLQAGAPVTQQVFPAGTPMVPAKPEGRLRGGREPTQISYGTAMPGVGLAGAPAGAQFQGAITPVGGTRHHALQGAPATQGNVLGGTPTGPVRDPYLWAFETLPRHRVGLSNLGNTCYQNAMMQCLASTSPLMHHFLTNTPQGSDSDTGWSVGSMLHSLSGSEKKQRLVQEFGRAMRLMHDSDHGANLDLSNFKSSLAAATNRFSGFSQEDSFEFLTVLRDALHEGMVAKQQGKLKNSILSDVFRGRTKSVVTCHACGHRSATDEPVWELAVDIPRSAQHQAVSLHDCLATYFAPESLTGDNQYHCARCRSKQDATMQIFMSQQPRVLAVVLKRFNNRSTRARYSAQKDTSPVCYPTKLESLQQFGGGQGYAPAIPGYHLYATSNHYGSSVNSGHFVAHIRMPPPNRRADAGGPEWWSVSDSSWSPLHEESPRAFTNDTAYVLFYRQVPAAQGVSAL